MADAFSLANIEAHRADFLGPGVVQTLVQALETGFLVSQSVRFWTRVAPGEPLLIRLLVAFVSLVAFFQTGAAFYSWWRIYVSNFGDWIASIDPGWPERIQSIVTALMATPVQAFLIWRCWHILHQSYFVLIPLAAILLGSLITSIVVTASILHFDFTSSLEPGAPPPPKMPVSIPFILSLALPAFLDILVTGILLVFLLRSRAAVYTRRFRRMLARLMLIAWESFLPPCACAVTAVITYGLLAREPQLLGPRVPGGPRQALRDLALRDAQRARGAQRAARALALPDAHRARRHVGVGRAAARHADLRGPRERRVDGRLGAGGGRRQRGEGVRTFCVHLYSIFAA